MGKIEDLASNYERHLRAPWPRTVAGAQRVILVVYDKELERMFRARKGEFEQRTIAAGHGWVEQDCTQSFAQWLAHDEYREAYFESPADLSMKLESEFVDSIVSPLRQTLRGSDANTVVALTGIASLYGFTPCLRCHSSRRTRRPRTPSGLLPWHQGQEQLPPTRRTQWLELPRERNHPQ
jgi:hypothetical protein